MKVLLVHNSYQQRGGEDVVFDQECDLLRRAGEQVVEYRRNNAELNELSAVGRMLAAQQTVWSRQVRRDFHRLLTRERPDVVHVHNTFLRISPSVYWACTEAGVPVVQTLHNYRLLCPGANLFREGRPCRECQHDGLWRGMLHGCYRKSRVATGTVAVMLALHRRWKTWTDQIDCHIALSEFSRREFQAAGMPDRKLVVKPNFVYPDPGVQSAQADYVVAMGRLSEEKGLTTLLKAWKGLGNAVPLLLIGDGPQRQYLQAQAEKDGISSVKFLGRLPRHEAMALLQRARFLVFPSECYENFPGAIVEAYACGVPVIASSLGAMEEMVRHGETGLLFSAGDSEGLREAAEWAWSHAAAMASMGRVARSEYERSYTAERNYTLLMNIYDRAIASKHGGSAALAPPAACGL